MQQIYPDIWVKIVENELKKLLEESTKPNIVISDYRFSNEINMLIRLGGKIIHVHINPPQWFYKHRAGEYPQAMSSKHVSEILWINVIIIMIDNSGTIEALHKKIKYIVEK